MTDNNIASNFETFRSLLSNLESLTNNNNNSNNNNSNNNNNNNNSDNLFLNSNSENLDGPDNSLENSPDGVEPDHDPAIDYTPQQSETTAHDQPNVQDADIEDLIDSDTDDDEEEEMEIEVKQESSLTRLVDHIQPRTDASSNDLILKIQYKDGLTGNTRFRNIISPFLFTDYDGEAATNGNFNRPQNQNQYSNAYNQAHAYVTPGASSSQAPTHGTSGTSSNQAHDHVTPGASSSKRPPQDQVQQNQGQQYQQQQQTHRSQNQQSLVYDDFFDSYNLVQQGGQTLIPIVEHQGQYYQQNTAPVMGNPVANSTGEALLPQLPNQQSQMNSAGFNFTNSGPPGLSQKQVYQHQYQQSSTSKRDKDGVSGVGGLGNPVQQSDLMTKIRKEENERREKAKERAIRKAEAHPPTGEYKSQAPNLSGFQAAKLEQLQRQQQRELQRQINYKWMQGYDKTTKTGIYLILGRIHTLPGVTTRPTRTYKNIEYGSIKFNPALDCNGVIYTEGRYSMNMVTGKTCFSRPKGLKFDEPFDSHSLRLNILNLCGISPSQRGGIVKLNESELEQIKKRKINNNAAQDIILVDDDFVGEFQSIEGLEAVIDGIDFSTPFSAEFDRQIQSVDASEVPSPGKLQTQPDYTPQRPDYYRDYSPYYGYGYYGRGHGSELNTPRSGIMRFDSVPVRGRASDRNSERLKSQPPRYNGHAASSENLKNGSFDNYNGHDATGENLKTGGHGSGHGKSMNPSEPNGFRNHGGTGSSDQGHRSESSNGYKTADSESDRRGNNNNGGGGGDNNINLLYAKLEELESKISNTKKSDSELPISHEFYESDNSNNEKKKANYFSGLSQIGGLIFGETEFCVEHVIHDCGSLSWFRSSDIDQSKSTFTASELQCMKDCNSASLYNDSIWSEIDGGGDWTHVGTGILWSNIKNKCPSSTYYSSNKYNNDWWPKITSEEVVKCLRQVHGLDFSDDKITQLNSQLFKEIDEGLIKPNLIYHSNLHAEAVLLGMFRFLKEVSSTREWYSNHNYKGLDCSTLLELIPRARTYEGAYSQSCCVIFGKSISSIRTESDRKILQRKILTEKFQSEMSQIVRRVSKYLASALHNRQSPTSFLKTILLDCLQARISSESMGSGFKKLLTMLSKLCEEVDIEKDRLLFVEQRWLAINEDNLVAELATLEAFVRGILKNESASKLSFVIQTQWPSENTITNDPSTWDLRESNPCYQPRNIDMITKKAGASKLPQYDLQCHNSSNDLEPTLLTDVSPGHVVSFGQDQNLEPQPVKSILKNGDLQQKPQSQQNQNQFQSSEQLQVQQIHTQLLQQLQQQQAQLQQAQAQQQQQAHQQQLQHLQMLQQQQQQHSQQQLQLQSIGQHSQSAPVVAGHMTNMGQATGTLPNMDQVTVLHQGIQSLNKLKRPNFTPICSFTRRNKTYFEDASGCVVKEGSLLCRPCCLEYLQTGHCNDPFCTFSHVARAKNASCPEYLTPSELNMLKDIKIFAALNAQTQQHQLAIQQPRANVSSPVSDDVIKTLTFNLGVSKSKAQPFPNFMPVYLRFNPLKDDSSCLYFLSSGVPVFQNGAVTLPTQNGTTPCQHGHVSRPVTTQQVQPGQQNQFGQIMQQNQLGFGQSTQILQQPQQQIMMQRSQVNQQQAQTQQQQQLQNQQQMMMQQQNRVHQMGQSQNVGDLGITKSQVKRQRQRLNKAIIGSLEHQVQQLHLLGQLSNGFTLPSGFNGMQQGQQSLQVIPSTAPVSGSEQQLQQTLGSTHNTVGDGSTPQPPVPDIVNQLQSVAATTPSPRTLGVQSVTGQVNNHVSNLARGPTILSGLQSGSGGVGNGSSGGDEVKK